LVFNTSSARTSDAGKALKRFGAEKVMMLDGGGSTQLICKGKPVISSDRLIPQALAVTYGPKQDRSSNSIHVSEESPPEEPPGEEPQMAMAASLEVVSDDPEVGAGRAPQRMRPEAEKTHPNLSVAASIRRTKG
jgi:hypothetical protein